MEIEIGFYRNFEDYTVVGKGNFQKNLLFPYTYIRVQGMYKECKLEILPF